MFFEITERCFEARLAGIEPSAIKCPSGKWTAAAVKRFQELVVDREVTVEVYSVVNRVASVTLFVDAKCVNDVLVAEGFAQECEESFPSKHNHESRKKIQKVESLQFDAAVEFKDYPNELLKPHIPAPPAARCTKKMFLVGPSSPMETTAVHCFMSSECSQVAVDSNSVNSVVLYDNPGNIYGRLMVAADVTKNKSCMTIRETLMMPDIPGLPLLLAAIFAPDVLFRRDRSETKYENMMFGLGTYNRKNSMFPEHDCILPVHFKLDDEDFIDINFLRFQMSCLLATNPMEQAPLITDQEKSEHLKEVKQLIMKILSKNREPLPMTYGCRNSHDWSISGDLQVRLWEDVFYGFSYHHILQPTLKTESPGSVRDLMEQMEKIEMEARA